jgi:hypothetical protein
MWLFVLNEYSSKSCSKTLVIYLYFTSLEKRLPNSNIDILDEHNVNTAFTSTCPVDSEIVIFRKEEWFKVLIHESFHNFALDFSDMSTYECTKDVLSIFPVNSEVNLFESYTEFWARIMNVLFCSYMHTQKNNIDEFLKYTEMLINFERLYAFFQMVKILNFMDIEYKQLYEKSVHATNVRKHLYKENTNILSYYIITLQLINNYQGFLSWCDTNNTSILQFKKTNANLDHFCEFIKKNYKTMSILNGIDCTEDLLTKVKHKAKKQKNLSYLLRNLRMTICELG